jgi:hypothetical protein
VANDRRQVIEEFEESVNMSPKELEEWLQTDLGQGPKNDIEDSKWRYSLMNCGHDPLKQ